MVKSPSPLVIDPTFLDLRAPLITKLRRGVGLSWIRFFTLCGVDIAMTTLAWILAVWIGTPVKAFSLWGGLDKPGFILPILGVTFGVIAASGLYGSDHQRRDYLGLIKALTLAQGVLLLIAFLYQPGLLLVSRSTFLLGWLFVMLWATVGRLLVNWAVVAIRRQGTGRWSIYLIGCPEDTQRALLLLEERERYKIVGEADLSLGIDKKDWMQTLEAIRQSQVAEVFVCSWQGVHDPMFLYWNLQSAGIRLRILPIGMALPQQRSRMSMLGGLPTIQFSPPSIIGSDFWVKRAFDLVGAGLLLLVLSPLYLALALWIKTDSPGPIFYRQTRVGLKGQLFKVWKFRTMVTNAEQLQKELEAKNEMKNGIMFKLKDDPRVTRTGSFLRRYSLDELPQIFNVLFGEMSLVGPRPFPVRDVERFSDHHFIRHEVLPGITGLWQVSGRSNIVDFEEVIRLDIAYIQNWSLRVDFQILLRTIKVVLRSEGAY